MSTAPIITAQRLADMDLPPPELDLSAKQWRFVRAYVDNPDNLKDCALAAGYADCRSVYATASTLLRSPKIQSAIAAIQADKTQSARLDADFVRRKITAALDQTPGDGIPWREWVQVLALSARVTGLVMPGERTTNVLSIGKLDGMSMDDLKRLAGYSDTPAIPAECTPDGDKNGT